MPEIVSIDIKDVAYWFGIPASELERRLVQMGWETIMNDACRIAASDAFGTVKRELNNPPLPTKDHVIDAIGDRFVDLDCVKANERKTKSRKSGYVYVLHAEESGLCKIGCTKLEDGSRQQKIISGMGEKVKLVLTVAVSNYRSVEKAAHRKFKSFRKSGEWFDVPVENVIDYFASEVPEIAVLHAHKESHGL